MTTIIGKISIYDSIKNVPTILIQIIYIIHLRIIHVYEKLILQNANYFCKFKSLTKKK